MPEAGDDDAPRVDRAVLAALEAAIGAHRVAAFLREYMADAAGHERSLREAWPREDWDGVYRAAHNLVSTAGNFGVMRVSYLADLLQRAARGRDAAAIAPLIERLAAEIAAADAELDRIYRAAE